MRIRQRAPELASLGRRACASCIDAACVLSCTGGLTGGLVVWGRVRQGADWRGWDDVEERMKWFMESRSWKRAEPVLALDSAISRRNWQTPGMYLMRIRRQDLRTGGPVTVRGALIRHLAGWGVQRLVSRQPLQPWLKRQQAQMQSLQGDVDAARRQHHDDPQAQQQAIMQVYRAAGVNPASSCWMPFIPSVINALVILCTPRHQSAADWVAGIVTARA